jgi:outer membrane protein assembly factor BamB
MHDPAHTQYHPDAGLNLPLTQTWSFEPSGNDPYPEAPVVVGDTVYISFSFEDEPSQVYALDVTTGALKWSREITGYTCYSSPAVADGLLYIGTGVCGFFGSGAYEGGYVYALDIATGEMVWERYFVGRADTVPGGGHWPPS